ncbi:MAG: Uncharacterized protein LiPW16_51 [Microgenomates group bacterium LiPW_16]|nr:MAG: Uncharacterized protein LiPW16_51 [Microgenomates group bacterium LiPW_16]
MLIKFILIILFSAAVLAGGAWLVFGPVENKDRPIVFTVTKDQNTVDVILKLKEQNLIKNKEAFGFLYLIFAKNKQILPGGYRLNKNLNAWQVLQKITSRPDLVWVTVPEGSRKEQIGELLAKALDWNESEQKKWNDTYTQVKQEYIEGVYFPDTYLIPRDEGGQAITQRFINNFNEKFAPYLPKFAQKNILWTTGIKIASLIQREAAGAEDMPLISGIIWNRLEKGMKLEIDATLQYIRGKTDEGWWGKVYLSDKQVDSPYNTYIYKGLPPHPIANPGLTAIEAALNPAETNCLYYLHDSNKQIHCAKTYEEHQENIRKFL